jgi:hypothetical protein
MGLDEPANGLWPHFNDRTTDGAGGGALRRRREMNTQVDVIDGLPCLLDSNLTGRPVFF